VGDPVGDQAGADSVSRRGWLNAGHEEIVAGAAACGSAGGDRGAAEGWVVLLILAVLAGCRCGRVRLVQPPDRPGGDPNPALVAPGGFRRRPGRQAITIGLEIRNTADIPVTVIGPASSRPPA
jgi:hypothetical protein